MLGDCKTARLQDCRASSQQYITFHQPKTPPFKPRENMCSLPCRHLYFGQVEWTLRHVFRAEPHLGKFFSPSERGAKARLLHYSYSYDSFARISQQNKFGCQIPRTCCGKPIWTHRQKKKMACSSVVVFQQLTIQMLFNSPRR